jgi:hypothetical protein
MSTQPNAGCVCNPNLGRGYIVQERPEFIHAGDRGACLLQGEPILLVKRGVDGSFGREGDDGKKTKEPFKIESIGLNEAVAEQMQAQIRIGDGARRGV